jgi:hypothetical protein
MRSTFFASTLAVLVLLPSVAFAANLSIYPPSIALKKGDSVGFIVHLQSQDSINTLGAPVLLPQGLAFLSAKDGTVFTQWVEHPTFAAADQSVSFAGITTNGWKGDGQVAVITVAAKEDGVYSLQFDKTQTEMYKNDGKATPEPVVYSVVAAPLLGTQGLAIIGFILLVMVLAAVLVRRKYKISFV